MKIIVPANNKGGVGKTKISILLSEYLAQILKKKVLAIDFDPQCNFSQRFLTMEIDPAAPGGKIPPVHPDYDPNDTDTIGPEGRSSIADIFFGQLILPYPTYIPSLELSPAHADRLLAAESVRRNEVIEKVHDQFVAFTQSPELSDAYDVIIIDTPPSKGPLTMGAIKAATHLVIPSVMEEAPIQGVYGMLQLWMQESIRREHIRPLELVGIIPNMFRQTNLHRDMLKSLSGAERIGKYVLPVCLNQRTSFAEVDAEGANSRSIFDLPDTAIAKKEAIAVCECILERVFAGGT